MTYTLFEFAKENAEDFMKDQVEVTREEQVIHFFIRFILNPWV